MKRRFMFFVLVFGVFASVSAQVSIFPDKNYPDFIFVRKNGAAVITGYTGTAKDVVIPDRLRGWPVQVIGDRAFTEKGITSVTIPYSVRTIGRWAFAGNQLTNVNVPYNAHLGREAFPGDTQISLIPQQVLAEDRERAKATAVEQAEAWAVEVREARMRASADAREARELEAARKWGWARARKQASDTNVSDSDKLDIGIALNPAGFLLSGPSLLFDFTKGSFNSEIELVFPSLDLISGASPVGGFGGLATFNYTWNIRDGDFGVLYLGGGLGYIWLKFGYYSNHLFTAGLNAGYRYETSLGIYFKVGSFVGAKYANEEFGVHVMPTLSTGYSF